MVGEYRSSSNRQHTLAQPVYIMERRGQWSWSSQRKALCPRPQLVRVTGLSWRIVTSVFMLRPHTQSVCRRNSPYL
jgi:hypothetical protein